MLDDIAEWKVWMAAANCTKDTIDQRVYQVSRILEEIGKDPWVITVDDLVAFLADGRLQKGWQPNTLKTWRASMRSFYRWGQGMGRRPDNPALLIPAVRVPRALPRPTPDRVYDGAEHEADERVLLMIHLGNDCGLRRGEISRVRTDHLFQDYVLDINDETGEVVERLGWILRVKGKGGHERLVPIEDSLAARVQARGPGWIFPSPVRPGPLTPAHVGKLVTRALAAGAQVAQDPRHWTTHTLRHRAGTKALAGTDGDLRATQEFLGHAKPETTAIYTEVPQAKIRRAMRAAAGRAA